MKNFSLYNFRCLNLFCCLIFVLLCSCTRTKIIDPPISRSYGMPLGCLKPDLTDMIEKSGHVEVRITLAADGRASAADTLSSTSNDNTIKNRVISALSECNFTLGKSQQEIVAGTTFDLIYPWKDSASIPGLGKCMSLASYPQLSRRLKETGEVVVEYMVLDSDPFYLIRLYRSTTFDRLDNMVLNGVSLCLDHSEVRKDISKNEWHLQSFVFSLH